MGARKRKPDPAPDATGAEGGSSSGTEKVGFAEASRTPGLAALVAGTLAWLLSSALRKEVDHVARDLRPTQRLTDDWPVPAELREGLACNLFCIDNTTKLDETMAKLVKERRAEQGKKAEEESGDWKTFVEDLCIERCLMDHSKGKKALGGEFTTAATLPPPIRSYLSCARSCNELLLDVAAGRSRQPAAEVLQRCGLVHVSLADDAFAELVPELKDSLEQLRPRDVGLVDKQSPLRSGREELWLPFEEPFLRFEEVLRHPEVTRAVRGFFANHSNVAVDHVNVVNAPGGAGERQALHSDVGRAGEHLELHLPLVAPGEVRGALPLDRGPTRFCPCTQGLTDLGNPHARSIRRYFASNQHCLDYADLSWILHSEVAGKGGPWLTLYDADVFHQGLENVSPEPRPVMVIALTSSQAAVHQRNYVRRNISAAHVDALVKYRALDLSKALGL